MIKYVLIFAALWAAPLAAQDGTPPAAQDGAPLAAQGSTRLAVQGSTHLAVHDSTPLAGRWRALVAADLPPGADPAQAPQAAGLAPWQLDLALWVRLLDGRPMPLEQALLLLERRPDWPSRARARRAIAAQIPQDAPPAQVIALFADAPPTTGAGLLAYVRALQSVGDQAGARAALAEGWPKVRLDAPSRVALIAAYGPLLAPHHGARADAMLWRGKADEARALAPLLAAPQRAQVAARLAYAESAPQAGQLDANLPPTPALAYARFAWLAKAGEYTAAAQLALAQSHSAQSLGQPLRWTGWRRVLVRWALRDGQPQLAYDLATSAHTSPDHGYAHADLTWLAGYSALVGLNDPQTALSHFNAFTDLVRTPVSLGRAWYWVARAEAALGHQARAEAAYAQAAQHQLSYYGQLAAAQIGAPLPRAMSERLLPVGAAEGALAEALLLLVAAEERGLAYGFATQLGETAPPEALRAAGVRLLAEGETFLALRLGKEAAARGILMPELYLPLHGLADVPMAVPPALALAIARQESEFRPDAGSPVGALGLMQLMPGTAQDMARATGQPYSRARLTSDWRYNATLGTAYLADLTERFGNSPVLIAAAYNAGPGRAYDWIARYGDPRDAGTDPVAWVEAIPLRETRNYVMRVLEAMRPYEARLTGAAPSAQITDLLRGAHRRVRPRARPAPAPMLRPRARPNR